MKPPNVGISLSAGHATAAALVLTEALSFWGGVDDHGTIVDVHHPQVGTSVVGTILFLPSGRGSSSSSSSLAELIRSGASPAGIVLARPDAIVALGAIVAAELYGLRVPVVVVSPADVGEMTTGDQVDLLAGELEGRLHRRDEI